MVAQSDRAGTRRACSPGEGFAAIEPAPKGLASIEREFFESGLGRLAPARQVFDCMARVQIHRNRLGLSRVAASSQEGQPSELQRSLKTALGLIKGSHTHFGQKYAGHTQPHPDPISSNWAQRSQTQSKHPAQGVKDSAEQQTHSGFIFKPFFSELDLLHY